MKRFKQSAAILLLACVHAAQAQPSFRGTYPEYATAYQLNPAHTGSIDFATGFKPPLKEAWSVDLSATQSAPAIAEDKVFTIGDDGIVTALDVTNGRKHWSKGLAKGDLPNLLGPAYDNGQLFVLNTSLLLTALVARSGKTKWVTQLPNENFADAPPMAADGQVYVGGTGEAGRLYAVDESSGAIRWQNFVENGDFSSPAYDGAGIYVAYPCHFYKFERVTGNILWDYKGGVEGGGGESPVVFGNRVYLQDITGCGDIIARAKDGFFLGSFDEGRMNLWGSPTIFANSKAKPVGVSLVDKTLVGWNGANGAMLWSFSGSGPFSTAPIVVNGTIFAGSDDGKLYAVSEKGRRVWNTTLAGPVTELAAGQGTLIVIMGSKIAAFVPQ